MLPKGSETIPLIAGLGALAGDYRILLCDVWGVLHNGVKAYDGVVDALTRFQSIGGTVLLLSNAPRPSPIIIEQLAGFGVPREAYHGIMTSGDATRDWLISSVDPRPWHHLGPERDLTLFEGLAIELSTDLASVQGIVCTGLFDDESETPDDYTDFLKEAASRTLPLLCANPDITVMRGDYHVYCAGALAEAYEAMGGEAVYFGKPYAPIYDAARRRMSDLLGGPVADREVLVVGDGLKTDILGANRQSLDALFITGGLSAGRIGTDPDTPHPDRVTELCHEAGVSPLAAAARLVW